MSNNIIPFPFNDEGVIDLARYLLDRAEAGDLNGLAVASVMTDDAGKEYIEVAFNSATTPWALIAAVTRLSYVMQEEMTGIDDDD